MICRLPESPDYLILTEHWLDPNSINYFNIEGYNQGAAYCRENSSHGGVIIFVKENVKFSTIDQVHKFSVEKEIEMCAISNNKIAVVGMYRVPGSNMNTCQAQLERALNYLDKFEEVIILGDYNACSIDQSNDFNAISTLFHQFGYHYLINEPTRGTRCIDNIFVKCTNSSCIGGVFNPQLSDHAAVWAQWSIRSRQDATSHQQKQHRKFSNENLEALKNSLLIADWTFVAGEESAEHKWERLTNTIVSHMDQVMPLRRVGRPRVSSRLITKWYTPELGQLSLHVTAMKEFYESDRSQDTAKELYLSARRRYRKRIKLAKIEANSTFIAEAQNKSKAMWQVIDRNRGVRRGQQVQEGKPSEEILKNYFENIAKNLDDALPPTTTDPTRYLPHVQAPILSIKTVREAEIWGSIKALKCSDTIDTYGLTTKVIKKIAQSITTPLTYLINECITLGTFPDQLKKTRICAIHKQGPVENPANYRPISILPILSKIYEKVIKGQLEAHFEGNNLITDNQFGFRKGTSTKEAILKLTNFILENFDQEKVALGSFYDVSKGFDCIPHDKLIMKLKHYSLSTQAAKLIESYLSGRGPWPYSVAQGSILGPLLYVIYSNDLSRAIEPADATMFADDTTSVDGHKDLAVARSMAMDTQRRVKEWMTSNRLTLNDNKTVNMTFSTRDLTLETNPDHTKFLGVLIDPQLRWDVHCRKLAAKLAGITYLIRNLVKCTNSSTVLMAYHGLFHSRLSYGLEAWGHSPHASKVFKMQRRVMRVIVGKGYREDCREDFVSMKIPTLFSLYAYHCALYTRNGAGDPRHQHHTRFVEGGNRAIPRNRMERTRNISNYWGVRCFNSLPNNVKALSVAEFKTKAMSHFLEIGLYSLNEL